MVQVYINETLRTVEALMLTLPLTLSVNTPLDVSPGSRGWVRAEFRVILLHSTTFTHLQLVLLIERLGVRVPLLPGFVRDFNINENNHLSIWKKHLNI